MKFIIGLLIVTLGIITAAFMLPNKGSEQTQATNQELAESLGASFDNEVIEPKETTEVPKIKLQEQVQSSAPAVPEVDSHLKRKQEELQRQYDNYQLELETQYKQRTKLEGEFIDLTSEMKQALIKIEELNAQNIEFEGKINSFTAHLSELENEYNSYHDEKDYVGKKPKGSGYHWDSNKRKYYKWKQVRNMTWMDYQNAKSKTENEIRFAQVRIKRNEKEIESLQTKFNITSDMKIDDIEYHNREIKMQLNAINKRIEQLLAEQNEVQDRLESLR